MKTPDDKSSGQKPASATRARPGKTENVSVASVKPSTTPKFVFQTATIAVVGILITVTGFQYAAISKMQEEIHTLENLVNNSDVEAVVSDLEELQQTVLDMQDDLVEIDRLRSEGDKTTGDFVLKLSAQVTNLTACVNLAHFDLKYGYYYPTC